MSWNTRPLAPQTEKTAWLDYAVAIIAFAVFMYVAFSIMGNYDGQQCNRFKPIMESMQACEDAGGLIRADFCKMPLNLTGGVIYGQIKPT